MAKSKRAQKYRVVKAWADIGSHGTPFMFAEGPVYERFGPLLHIWHYQVAPDLVQVEIRIPRRKEQAK